MSEYVVITKQAHADVIEDIEGEWGSGHPGSFPRGTDPLTPVEGMVAVERARIERLLAFACKFRDETYAEDYDVWEAFSKLTESDLQPIP